MIDNLPFGVFEVTCDECSHSEEIDVDGVWNYLISEMKTSGWLIRKIKKEWYHFCCDECKRKNEEDEEQG